MTINLRNTLKIEKSIYSLLCSKILKDEKFTAFGWEPWAANFQLDCAVVRPRKKGEEEGEKEGGLMV